MSVTFTKLFSSITESTIWREDDKTRILWITMLAMADRKGRVWASVPGLADRARISLPDCVAALNRFMSPDEWSRTKDNDGIRIAEIDGGWVLLNYDKYRAIRDQETIKETNRLSMRRRRAKEVDECVHSVPQCIQAEAEAEAEADKQTNNMSATSSRDAAVKAPKKQTNPNVDIIITCFNETGKLLGWTPFRPTARSTRINTILANRASDADFMANLPKYAKMMQSQTWTEGWGIESFLRPGNMKKCLDGFWDKNKQEPTTQDVDMSKPWNNPDYVPEQPTRVS